MDQGNNDAFDSDVHPATGRTIVTNLEAGETDATWDLGLYLAGKPASIGDRVWFDSSANGIQETGETGIAGVTVTLYRGDGTRLAVVSTDVDGNYHFTNLALGEYYIEFAPPAGYIGTAANQGVDLPSIVSRGLTIARQ